MTPLSRRYEEKVDSLSGLLELLQVKPGELLGRYAGQSFPGTSISKERAFAEVLACQLSDDTEALFEGACGPLSHFRDRRSGPEYAADLVIGWIAEDGVLAVLGRMNSDAVLSGHDRYREFLPPRLISTQPDIRVSTRRGPTLLEVFADWSGHWRKTGEIDLRDAKYDRLVQESALMLGLAPKSSEAYLIDFATDRAVFAPAVNPRYGGKWVYRSDQARELLAPADLVLGHLAEIVREGAQEDVRS